MKQPLIVIAGPTACGKTGVSIALAKKFQGEIISGDSMQVYRGMDIGTAKATKAEMDGVIHHLIDVADPDEDYSVARFQGEAKEALAGIYGRGKLPILVGGTGFYINALVKDNSFTETENDYRLRSELYAEAETFGAVYLHEKLKKVDPKAAEAIHPNNVKRVARAIEFYTLTGMPISAHNEAESRRESPYDLTFVVLTMDRGLLYERINRRVDLMVEAGLVDEVHALLDAGYTKDLVSMRGLGYKEIIPYLEGRIPLSQAVEDLKQATRRFAKRQLTWFQGQTKDALWIDVTEKKKDEIAEMITEAIGV